MAFLLLVAFASLLTSPSLISASSLPGGGFKAVLKHVDYGKSLSSNEHFQRAVQRSKMAVESRKTHPYTFINGLIKPGNGEFFMNLTIGTPPTTYLAFIDTDTDFIWTACKPITQCGLVRGNINCSNHQTYDPSKSSSYTKLSCTSATCKLATNTTCNKNDNNSCAIKYQYPAGSPGWVQGDLAIETFGSSSSINGKASFAELIFGCAHATSIEYFKDIGSGFAGMGRGNMSLVSQLKVTKFSHRFPSYDNPNKTGEIAFGSYARTRKGKGTVTTDIIQNPNQPSSYYVALKGIKVNDAPLAIESSAFEINTAGVGGVVIDSGMSVSYLEQGAYNKLKEKVISLIKLQKVESEAVIGVGLDLCYKIPKQVNAGNVDKYLPNISFTFGYGNSKADLVLRTGNAFRSYYDLEHGEVSCLAMAAAPGSDGRSSLGNMQLQETLVVYDLAAKKVSFTPYTRCQTM